MDLHAIKSMGGWNDDEFSAQEICETASATGGSADTIKFKWDSDPCQGESVTKCRSIYFRYNNLDSQILVLFKLHSLWCDKSTSIFSLFLRLEGRDSGGVNCQTNENYPCRTAKAAQVTVSHLGMTCGATISSLNKMLLVATAIAATFFHLIS